MGGVIRSKRILSFVVSILLLAVNIITLMPIAGGELEGWSEDIRLTFNFNRSILPAIAAYHNYVHVIFMEDEGDAKSDLHLCYIRSNDYGETWSNITRITNDTVIVFPTKIVVNENEVHILYSDQDSRIHYINSLDNGNTWNSDMIITTAIGPPASLRKSLDIGVYENNIHVAFIDPDYKLSYTMSKDNGMTWSDPAKLVSTFRKALGLRIAVNKYNVHIIWEDLRDKFGNYVSDIFYIRSVDNGDTWGEEVSVSFTPDFVSREPDITVSGDVIHVIYADYRERYIQIFYNHSDDNGVTWHGDIKVSNSTTDAIWSAITSEGNNVFVVWVDRTPGAVGLHYRNSSDNGITWSSDTQLTYKPASPGNPDLAISNNYVHVVWYDYRHDPIEIYYKRYFISKPPIRATIDIHPDTLNLKSKGRWITAYIELPEGYDVNDIDISSILLEDAIPAAPHPTEIGDYDGDGIPDLMVKFDRSNVEDILSPGKWVLTLTGLLSDGTAFEGSDSIRVISPPRK